MIKKLLEFFSGIPMVGITTAIINAETGQGWIKESKGLEVEVMAKIASELKKLHEHKAMIFPKPIAERFKFELSK